MASNQNYLGINQTEIFVFLPPPLISNISTILRHSNDVAYFNPKQGDQCWAAKLPCTPEQPKNIQLRFSELGVGKGFTYQVIH